MWSLPASSLVLILRCVGTSGAFLKWEQQEIISVEQFVEPKGPNGLHQLALRVRLASQFLNQVDEWEGPGMGLGGGLQAKP